MKKILILNDGSKYENWGMKACIAGLKKILSQIDSIELRSLDYDFMNRRYAFEPKIFGKKIFDSNGRFAKSFLKRFHKLPAIADEFEFFADLWLSGKGGKGADEFIKEARACDLIIFNGEGSTYRNNIGAIKGLFMLWFAKTRLNKKAVFMNGSVTLTRVDAVLPAMIRKVFSVIDLAIVREPFSYQNILDFYPELKESLQLMPDSAFALDLNLDGDSSIENLDFMKKDFFVFSLSMLPMDYRVRHRSFLADTINALKEVVPNAVFIAKDGVDQVLRDLAKDTDSYFIGAQYNYGQIAQILAKAKFIFSGRYHNAIFATKVGCPVIPLASSSHKIHGLAKFFDFMPGPIDPTDLRSEKARVLDSARKIMSEGEELRAKYSRRSSELRKEALSQAEFVSKLL